MYSHQCGDRAATRRTKLKTAVHVPIQRKQIEGETKSNGHRGRSCTEVEWWIKLNGRPNELMDEIAIEANRRDQLDEIATVNLWVITVNSSRPIIDMTVSAMQSDVDMIVKPPLDSNSSDPNRGHIISTHALDTFHSESEVVHQ
jgi:hypothetical protein